MPRTFGHSHRIDTADLPVVRQALDVEYNLARAEGQLVRAEQIMRTINSEGDDSGVGNLEMTQTLTNAKRFLTALRLALSPNRADVT